MWSSFFFVLPKGARVRDGNGDNANKKIKIKIWVLKVLTLFFFLGKASQRVVSFAQDGSGNDRWQKKYVCFYYFTCFVFLSDSSFAKGCFFLSGGKGDYAWQKMTNIHVMNGVEESSGARVLFFLAMKKGNRREANQPYQRIFRWGCGRVMNTAELRM